MDKDQKVLDLIAEYEAEALRCTRMAERLKEALTGYAPPEQTKHAKTVVLHAPTKMHTNGEPVSALTASVNALSSHGKPMHVKELIKVVSELRGVETSRAFVESVLVRAIKNKKHGITRTAPATFTVRR